MSAYRSDTGFPCTNCGACCRVAGGHYGLPRAPDGSCANLARAEAEGREVWLCSIYETRPEVCRVGFSKPVWIDIEDYHVISAHVCNDLQKRLGIDESYRVFVDWQD